MTTLRINEGKNISYSVAYIRGLIQENTKLKIELKLTKENFENFFKEINGDEFIKYSNCIDKIAYDVLCEMYKIDIGKSSRQKEYLKPRQFFFKYLKTSTAFSLKNIGKKLMENSKCEDREIYDHSTVINGIKRFDEFYETEPLYRKEYEIFVKEVSRRFNLK